MPASKTGSGLFALLPQPQNKTTTRRPLEYVNFFLFLPTESWFCLWPDSLVGWLFFRQKKNYEYLLCTVGAGTVISFLYCYSKFLSVCSWFQRIPSLSQNRYHIWIRHLSSWKSKLGNERYRALVFVLFNFYHYSHFSSQILTVRSSSRRGIA